MSTQKLILGYWNCRGLAQATRLQLEYLGLPYEQKKYNKLEEWFGGDNAREPFKNHSLTNLPYLIDGDRYIYESKGIETYLALKAGRKDLLGVTPEEIVRLAQIQGVIYDMRFQFMTIIMDKVQYAEKSRSSYQVKVVPFLHTLNQFIEGKKFSVSDRITVADFHLYELIQTFHAYNSKSLQRLQNLDTFKHNIEAIPQIDAYLKSDRFQSRPFYMSDEWFSWTG